MDPLNQIPEAGRALFDIFRQQANGFPEEAVRDAAANLMLNALRQHCGTWKEAEQKFDDQLGRMKQALKNHYDNVTGRRHAVFPYHQVIGVPKMDFRKPYGKGNGNGNNGL